MADDISLARLLRQQQPTLLLLAVAASEMASPQLAFQRLVPFSFFFLFHLFYSVCSGSSSLLWRERMNDVASPPVCYDDRLIPKRIENVSPQPSLPSPWIKVQFGGNGKHRLSCHLPATEATDVITSVSFSFLFFFTSNQLPTPLG